METLLLYHSPYNKIRLGKPNDGGSVITELPEHYDSFISIIASNDILFEIDLINKYSDTNPDLKCNIFNNNKNIKTNNLNEDLKKKINYINEQTVNVDNVDTNVNITNLHYYLKDYMKKYHNIFMKMDIEGHEFRLLPKIMENDYIINIKQLVVEIHSPADIEMFPDYFKGLSDIKNEHMFELFNTINKTHTLIHFHANNGCNRQIIDTIEMPHVFECTYIRNDYYTTEKIKNIISLPMNIDMKNIPYKDDFYINYYPFCNYDYKMDKNKCNDYIFIIYSCKKKLSYANNIFTILKNKLMNCDIYIIYGDTTIEGDYKILYNYLILNVEDDYYNLSKKTLALIKTVSNVFPNIKGMFKCDDDIIPNINHLNNFILSDIIKLQNYCGKSVNHKNAYTCVNIGYKYSLNENVVMPVVNHCPGPLYFLSKISMDIFKHQENIIYHECEDILVGLTLNNKLIFPSNNKLFSNNIKNKNSISVHNHKCDKDLFNSINNNNLTIKIHGGLGNQLFQIISALGFCYKYNKNFIVSKNNISKNDHETKEQTINNIKTLFPDINILDNLDVKSYHIYREESTFSYTDINIDLTKNILLEGYFINKKYFPESFLELFTYNISSSPNTLKYNEITQNFENTYFIHIRLGDYVNNYLYKINLTDYYIYCINKIKEHDSLSKFIICTNEYGINLDNYINNFPKDINYIIQDSNHTSLDTLYIMSSCKGGICSNSTLSWLGIYFQKNRKKDGSNAKNVTFMPYPWINFIGGYNKNNTIDIYPEWVQVYNTINNTIDNDIIN